MEKLARALATRTGPTWLARQTDLTEPLKIKTYGFVVCESEIQPHEAFSIFVMIARHVV